MTVFVAGAIGLLLLAAALVILRRDSSPRPADEGDPNLRWYRQREKELEESDPLLLQEAELRLLEDGGIGGANSEPVKSTSLGLLPMAGLCLLMAVAAVLIYERTGSVEDVLIYRDLGAIAEGSSEAQRQALLGRIEARSRERTDNLHYLGLLGRLHMAAEDYPAASDAYGRLAEKAPQDPQALALAAQASFLAAGRQLDESAQLLAEQSLAVDPNQRTALGLLGMASFETGAYGAAVSYWERLQAQEQPGSPGYEMLGDVLALARERGGLATAGVDSPTQVSARGDGVSVQLSIDEALNVAPDSVVFVFARPAAAAGGMPIAVRRLQASQLPMTLRLADADAMAGQLISEAGPVVVSVQVSRNGQPGESNALYTATSAPVTASADAAVAIRLAADGGSTAMVLPTEPAGDDEVGISVALSLAESLQVPADAIVYVFARSAASNAGMPVAVRRLQAGQLPTTLRLADADAMAGQRLSEAGEVVVSVQVSANGQPGAANALYSAASAPVTATSDAAVAIQLGPDDGAG